MSDLSAIILEIHADNPINFDNFVWFLDIGFDDFQFLLFLVPLINAITTILGCKFDPIMFEINQFL